MDAQKSAVGGRVPRDTLAARLRLLRGEIGLSRRDAAMRSGVPLGTWQGMEEGRDSRKLPLQLTRIANTFGYDRDWLVWGGPLADGMGDGPDGETVIGQYLTHDPHLWLVEATG